MGTFADSLKANIAKKRKEINDNTLKIVIDVFSTAVKLSPTQPTAQFAKGQFINNWFPMVGGYSSNTSASYDLQGTGSLMRIKELQSLNVFDGKDATISLCNSTPYAELIEYKGWPAPKWSGVVGPYAPVRNTITYILGKYKA